MNKLEIYVVKEFELAKALNELYIEESKIDALFARNEKLLSELTEDDKKILFCEEKSFYTCIKEFVSVVMDKNGLVFVDKRNFWNLCDALHDLLHR